MSQPLELELLLCLKGAILGNSINIMTWIRWEVLLYIIKFQAYCVIKDPESNPRSDWSSELWGIALYNQVCEITKE